MSHSRLYVKIVVILVFCLFSGQASTEINIKKSFQSIGQNTKESFLGWNSAFHLGAFGMTYLLINQGIDRKVQNAVADDYNPTSLAWSLPGLILGSFAPVVVPLTIMYKSDDSYIVDGGSAALQSVIIATGTQLLLKSISNRGYPEANVKATQDDTERFGFDFRPQGREGWPSGHTMTAVAMATSLSTYFHDRPWVAYTSYGWAAYVFASVTLGHSGGIHWFSDGVASIFMGWAIGRTVGKNYLKARKGTPKETSNFMLYPHINRDLIKLTMRFTF